MSNTTQGGLSSVPIRRLRKGSWRDTSDTIAPEVRVTLLWPGIEPVGLWAFPKDLDELALGYAKVEFCGPEQTPLLERQEEYAYHLSPAPAPEPPSTPKLSLDAGVLIEAMRELIEAGGRWDATGCFHRAGAFDPAKDSFARVIEDIGRHNCIDRLAGWALKNGRGLESLVLIITARATASLAAKASKAGFPSIISRSAVTTAAVAAAEEAGVTLAGFTREKEDRTSIFTDPKGLIA